MDGKERELKKTLILLLVVALLTALTVFAGCGNSKEASTEEQEGAAGKQEDQITVEETGQSGKSGKVTVPGENGDTTYEVGEERIPTEEELGVLIYPGAEYVPGTGIPMSKSSATGEVSIITAEFTTSKAANKVISWYQNILGQPQIVDDTTGETGWVIRNSDTEVITVTIKSQGSAANISIAKVSGDLSSMGK
jgi:hypothetical protein